MALKTLAGNGEIIAKAETEVLSALTVPVQAYLPEIAAGAGLTVSPGAIFIVRSSDIGSVEVLDIRGRRIATVGPYSAMKFTAGDAGAENWHVASSGVSPATGVTTVAAAPAGGAGAAAGAYDTAVNRDALIATVNGMRTALIAQGLLA